MAGWYHGIDPCAQQVYASLFVFLCLWTMMAKCNCGINWRSSFTNVTKGH